MQNVHGTTETAIVIDGIATAKAVRENLSLEIEKLVKAGNRRPGLAVLLIGADPASHVYVKNKILACKKTGIESYLYEMPETASKDQIMAQIKTLNEQENVDGILVQLPLPKGLPTEEILMCVSPEKDADGLHPHNLGLFVSGQPALRPCTPSGIMLLLDRYNIAIEGKTAVVIGRSNLVGKPIALMLMERNATVTMCHSKSKDLKSITNQADILIVAAGRQEMVKADWIKPGAVVIDVGTHRIIKSDGSTGLAGDVVYEEVKNVASHITPVPGGVGPMTIAVLLANTVTAYKNKLS